MALDRQRGPEVVAGAIAFLASADGAHVNGTILKVDGGTLALTPTPPRLTGFARPFRLHEWEDTGKTR